MLAAAFASSTIYPLASFLPSFLPSFARFSLLVLWGLGFGLAAVGLKQSSESRMMMGGGSRYPFTASQWQELELQALVFKYMVSGIPVPSDLILCIRRSLFMDHQALPFIPNPPTIGWGAYQLGDGRKPVDPEPGRCRRTDGKKWRCSKEAYPDSKYCERHMHRGKSRSRKPVELSLATNPTSSQFSSSNFVAAAAAAAAAPPPPPPPPPLSLSTPQTHHFLLPCPSSSRPPAMGFSLKDDSASFCLDSSPYTVDNYRNILGFKEGVNEYPFLSEACRAGREMPCRLGSMDMSSVEETKQSFGYMQGAHPHSRICLSEEQDKEKHYFVLGADLKTDKSAKLERAEQPQNARPFHCFLDEKPQKMEDSWMSMDADLKMQLSISIPMANHDKPVAASQRYNDG
ncbi:growth-regulating factor 1-like isoform X2 [Musa acuminata AAA Group]|uniref:growth-regulating factor 1-like isoform X2 n=1 Tax=Musa acuminata AAA Group TaxID=214697 RepID=UPI0031D4839E